MRLSLFVGEDPIVRPLVYDCSRSYCGGFLDGEPPRASELARVRIVPILPRGISRLTPLNDKSVRLV